MCRANAAASRIHLKFMLGQYTIMDGMLSKACNLPWFHFHKSSIKVANFESKDPCLLLHCMQDIVQQAAPGSLPFTADMNITQYAAGAAFKRTHILNWYHSLTEDSANYAARFCKYLNLCKFEDFHGPHKVYYWQGSEMPSEMPKGVRAKWFTYIPSQLLHSMYRKG